MTFYSNDVTGQPSKQVMDPTDNPEIIDLVGGLAPLFRWTGDKSMAWTAIIFVYNFFHEYS